MAKQPTAYPLKIPKLRARTKVLLYIFMLFFSALALIGAIFSYFPEVVRIAIYVMAACTLFTGMYYLVMDIRYLINNVLKPKIVANPHAYRVSTDYRLRTFVFAVPGLVSNIGFALFNGVIGFLSHSAWFGSLAAYYLLLSMMRVGAVRQERRLMSIQDERLRLSKEILVYRWDSMLFILMSIILFGMVILLYGSEGGNDYPGMTIYVVAMYSFYKIINSTIHLFKRQIRISPLLAIVRKIGYVDACVSILILQTAMFASFGNSKTMTVLMNTMTGAVVCLIVLGLGMQGIYVGRKYGN